MKKLLLPLMALLLVWGQSLGQSKETRNFNTFTKIAFRVPGKLILKQGDVQKVELEGDSETLSKTETEVEGSKLIIGRENKWMNWNWHDDNRITVYITVKNIDALSVSGSGDLVTTSKFTTGDLELKVSGSGSLQIETQASGLLTADVSGSGRIDVKGNCRNFDSSISGSGKVMAAVAIAEKADVSISGSGKIEASGSAKEIKTTISGSGKVLAANLEVDLCEVRISGSGDMEIAVKSELDASISGSGSVSYRGSPAHVNSHSSGSGHVRKISSGI